MDIGNEGEDNSDTLNMVVLYQKNAYTNRRKIMYPVVEKYI